MIKQEKKYIGDACYISLSSKTELVRADESFRIPLSVTEYKILSYFIDHVERPVYLEELARHVWGIHADEKDPHSLKSQISRVRGKLDRMRGVYCQGYSNKERIQCFDATIAILPNIRIR